MTRSMIKNISAWFRSSFWDKLFVRKRTEIGGKRTPPSYYRAKTVQQLRRKR